MTKPQLSKHGGRAPGTVPLALDSGAFSLYNKMLRKENKGKFDKGGKQDIQGEDFQKYFYGYVDFVKQHHQHFQFVTTLDVLFDPEASWEVYKVLQEETGQKILPVYHYGEDVKWLQRYMEDTDHIGLGGLGNITKATYLPFGDRCWKMLCDGKGRPQFKVHGFAMSSFDLMSRWPWHTVDSTTSFTFSRMGALTLPHRYKQGREGFNFSVTPTIVPVASRRGHHDRHIEHRQPGGHVRAAIQDYLDLVGVTLQDVKEEYIARDIANLYFMNNSVKAISRKHAERLGQAHSLTYFASGSPTASMQGFQVTLEHLQEHGNLDHLGYLGTYFPGMRRPTTYLLEQWHGVPSK